MKYIACVAEKCTKKQMSQIYEIEANSDYHCCALLEEITGIHIDGKTNYADVLIIDENEDKGEFLEISLVY